MKVIIDERETALYEKCESILCSQRNPSYIQLSKEVLNLGDILIKTDEDKEVLLIERKSLSDLLASIKDGRYEEQSYRLLHSSGFPPHSVFYLVEGMLSQLRAPIEKKIILSSIATLQFFKGFSVHRTASVQESAEWLLQFADKIERNFLKGIVPYYLTRPFFRGFTQNTIEPLGSNENTITTDEQTENISTVITNSLQNTHEPEPADYCHVVKKVKKENVTPENMGEIILCQIPGISSVTAIAIMKRFSHFTHLMEELTKDPTCVENLTIETNGKIRKISKSVSENIHKYLLNQ
jgi:ERCC4-type nuclease